tara:strand:- start:1013 stop:1207 length:195 start_codon:yes stop_codon:yes gene_type:complete
LSNILESLKKRIEDLENDMDDLKELLEIEDDHDIYGTEVEAENAYPDCECDEPCEDCDAEYDDQ